MQTFSAHAVQQIQVTVQGPSSGKAQPRNKQRAKSALLVNNCRHPVLTDRHCPPLSDLKINLDARADST